MKQVEYSRKVDQVDPRCYVPELIFGHLLTSDNYAGGTQGQPEDAYCDYSRDPFIEIDGILINTISISLKTY